MGAVSRRSATLTVLTSVATVALLEVAFGDGSPLAVLAGGAVALPIVAFLHREDGPLERRTAAIAAGSLLLAFLLAALWLRG